MAYTLRELDQITEKSSNKMIAARNANNAVDDLVNQIKTLKEVDPDSTALIDKEDALKALAQAQGVDV